MKNGKSLYIAVEGCVGIGKTTLATNLAKARRSALMLEEFEKNPFLGEFYEDQAGNVMETEMQFLLLHFHQLKKLWKAPPGETVTDFSFVKDLIFAETNLVDKAEKKMFVDLYCFFLLRLPVPDLIIYLKGSNDLIIERIRERNRVFELKTDMAYFKNLKPVW